jgi:GT2 family glycosyltransferase
MNKMTASIVIPTVGRKVCIEDCARSLNEVGTPQEVELVVIDAGGEGEVDEMSLQAIRSNSRVIKSTVRNAGIQRNMGVKQAKGEIVIFLDDDCYVQPGWWPAIIKPLLDDCRLQTTDRRPQTEDNRLQMADGRQKTEDEAKRVKVFPLNNSTTQQPKTATPVGGVACVAGAVWMNPHPQFTDKPGGFVNWFGVPSLVTHRSEKAPREVDWPISCNMACLKEAYVVVGGMADIYGVYDEDVDFGLKLRSARWRIIFEPGAAVYHYSLTRRQQVKTKNFEFRAGRNRAMLLVRNYGFSIRLLLFLVTSPFIQCWDIVTGTILKFIASFGHAAAYVAGMIVGVGAGLRNPVKQDRNRFDAQKK